MTIKENIQNLLSDIRETAYKCSRNPNDIQLIPVSKTFSADSILEAYEAGLRIFGENRLQEAESKITELADYDIKWHLLGHLQSNKAKKAVQHFQMIQSIDKISTLQKVNECAGAINKIQDVLIEVNTSGEESKSGISANSLNEFILHCQNMKQINLCGLMTVGPLTENVIAIKNSFSLLKDLFDKAQEKFPQYSWKFLSMGMTDDYKIAIQCGSNMLRIGRKIFGPRSL